MAFTDLVFIFLFLPISLLIYYAANDKYKSVILLGVSLLFYACGDAEGFGLLVFTLLVNLVFNKLIFYWKDENQVYAKAVMIIAVVYNVAFLAFDKYFNFTVENINSTLNTSFEARDVLVPLGLSFFVFKAISLQVDSYNGKIEEYNALTVATYLSFFAQIQSGPISRYDDLTGSKNIVKKKMTMNAILEGEISEGITRFVLGASKKVLLANSLSNITIEIFDNTADRSMSLAWLGAICYSLQLYYDFSGYSDMAIGISNMFGIKCPENFDYPYSTKSFAEFWRRWHITLGAWFRDYVYIPMGGSRDGKKKLYFNLFVVWLLTGIWHGASWNFVAWGLIYFALIAMEKAFNIPNRFQQGFTSWIYRIFALFIINIQWVMFRSKDFVSGIEFIKSMLIRSENAVATARAEFLFDDYRIFIIIAFICAFPVVPMVRTKLEAYKVAAIVFQVVEAIVIMALFIVSLSFVMSGQSNPFLYANF